MNTEPDNGQKGGKQSIEELQSRYLNLNTRKIQAETNLENAKRQLESLKQDARDRYGTDDLIELRQKLTAMTAENEKRRSTYQADLDRIESELKAVEQKFAGTETTSIAEEPTI